MADNLKNQYYNTLFNHLKDMKGYAFVSNGKAVLYAGKLQGNWARANAYAHKHGMTPIEKTQAGAALNKIPQATIDSIAKAKQAMQASGAKVGRADKAIWISNSRQYAKNITGNVKTFVCGADKDSIFRQTELPTILNNRKITGINGLDRTSLRKFYHETFDRLKSQGMERRQAAGQAKSSVHRKVAIAEVRQDLSIAKNTRDKALHADALERLGHLKVQHKAELQEKVKSQSSVHVKSQDVTNKSAHDKGQDRSKAIYERAFDRGIKNGLDAVQSRQAALMHVNHVTQRHELMKTRHEVFAQGKRIAINDYIAQRQECRQEAIKERRDMAQLHGKAYKGPALMPEKFKAVDQQIKSREMYVAAQLEKNKRQGHLEEREYSSLKSRNDSILAESRQHDLNGYFKGLDSKSFSSEAKSEGEGITSSFLSTADLAAVAASYGYNSYSYTATATEPAQAQNASHGYAHGRSH